MTAPFTGWLACIHGIDAGTVRLYRDEAHRALYVELGGREVSIRIQLPGRESSPVSPEDLERDRKGLRRLAEVAAQAAQELGQLLGLGDEDQAGEDTRPTVREAACPETSDGQHCGDWYDGGKCCACGQDGPEPDDQDDDPVICSTCGGMAGIFQDRPGWLHYRGDGTADSPVEIYDAGHDATFATGPGGAS